MGVQKIAIAIVIHTSDTYLVNVQNREVYCSIDILQLSAANLMLVITWVHNNNMLDFTASNILLYAWLHLFNLVVTLTIYLLIG